jgi:type I restriction enzyme S subunit
MMETHVIPNWWEVASLSDVVSKLVDGSHNPPAKQSAGLPMLSAVNINDNKIIFSDYRLISEDAFLLEDRRTRIAPSDVLLTIVGAIGRAAVVPEVISKFTLQCSVAVITPNL